MSNGSLPQKSEHVFSFENFTMVPFDIISKKDYEDYKSIVTDEDIMKTISLFNCKVPDDEKEIQRTYDILTEVNRLSDVPLSYKVISNDGELMGLIMSAILEKDANGEPAVVDFGHMFKKEYRGTVPLVVSSVMAKQSFKSRSVKRIIATAIADNYNAQAIILRRGFDCIGQLKKGNNGPLVNIFELTKERFFSGIGVRIKDIKNYIDEMSKKFSNGTSQTLIKPFCTRI